MLSQTIFLIVFVSYHAECETTVTPPIGGQELEGKVDTFLRDMLSCRDIIGASLAVLRGNETLLLKGYGKTEPTEHGQDVTSDTLFGVASLSKALAATLLGHVAKQNG